MSKLFPYNYLSVIFSPRRIFQYRKYLSSWQKILIILLLNSLLMVPMAFQVGRMTFADLVNYVPQTINFIDEEVLSALHLLDSRGNQLEIDEVKIIKESEFQIVAFAKDIADVQEILTRKNGIVFLEDRFIIQEEGVPVINQLYTGEKPINESVDVSQLVNLISQQWFWSNRPAIIITNYIYVWLLIVISFVLLIGGASFFLSFMKHNNNYDISSFSESLTIVLNSIGLPTIIASIIGSITGNAIQLLTAQSLSFIMMLILVYWRTHFNDSYTEKTYRKEEQ